MTYGDEAVLFPVADLYDQGAMRMYIEAAKDLYDRGQKAIDDFIAKYGDFTSPILADVEYWDNNTMKPLIDMIDEFLRNGIDPARSREARNALMARARRLPYALLSAIKQNAEDARQFRAAQLKLILEGKYNEAYRDYDGVDLNTFRTVGENGQINRIGNLSPTPIQDLTTFSNPFFQDVKPRVTKTTKNGITEESESLTQQDLLDLASRNFNAMVATPQGQIMYKYLVDQYISNGADPDEAESLAAEAFIKNVAASLERRLTDNKAYSDTKSHELELARQSAALKERELDYKEALLQLRQLGSTGSRSGVGASTNGDPTLNPLHSQIQFSVNNKVADALGVSPSADRRTIQSNYDAVILYYKDKMAGIELLKGKRVEDGYEEITEEVPMRDTISPTTGASPILSQRTVKLTKRVPKYKYVYDSTNDSEYKRYKDKLDYYQKLKNGEYDPLTSQEKSVLMKLDAKLKNGETLGDTEQKIYNHLAKKVTDSDKVVRQTYINDLYRALSNETKGGENFASTNDKFYGMFTFTPRDEAGVKTAVGILTGYADKREYKSLPGKWDVVDFAADGIEFAPIRKANVSGPRTYKYNALQNKFSRWLKKGGIEGILLSRKVLFASIPREFSLSGEPQLDVVASPSIRKEDLLAFIETLPTKNMENIDKKDVAEIARRLGLTPRNEEGTILNSNKDGYDKATYYDVPITRTASNYEGFSYSQMDDQYNIYKFGQAKAYENAPNSAAGSLTPEELLNIEEDDELN